MPVNDYLYGNPYQGVGMNYQDPQTITPGEVRIPDFPSLSGSYRSPSPSKASPVPMPVPQGSPMGMPGVPMVFDPNSGTMDPIMTSSVTSLQNALMEQATNPAVLAQFPGSYDPRTFQGASTGQGSGVPGVGGASGVPSSGGVGQGAAALQFWASTDGPEGEMARGIAGGLTPQRVLQAWAEKGWKSEDGREIDPNFADELADFGMKLMNAQMEDQFAASQPAPAQPTIWDELYLTDPREGFTPDYFDPGLAAEQQQAAAAEQQHRAQGLDASVRGVADLVKAIASGEVGVRQDADLADRLRGGGGVVRGGVAPTGLAAIGDALGARQPATLGDWLTEQGADYYDQRQFEQERDWLNEVISTLDERDKAARAQTWAASTMFGTPFQMQQYYRSQIPTQMYGLPQAPRGF